MATDTGTPAGRLPETIFEAKKRAAPRAVLRVVPYGESASQLPADASAFVGPASSPIKFVRQAVLTLAISAAAVWIVTVNAWDHDGFFPWFWNVIWLVFPWVFLAPLWAHFFRSLRRKPANDTFRTAYRDHRASATRAEGRIEDVRVHQADTGNVANYAALVSTPSGPIIVGTMAPNNTVPGYEAPRPGDHVFVWRFPDGWTLLQADRSRASGPAGATADIKPEQVDAAVNAPAPTTAPAADDTLADDPTLPERLEQLAELYKNGTLTSAEFDAAKRKLLDS